MENKKNCMWWTKILMAHFFFLYFLFANFLISRIRRGFGWLMDDGGREEKQPPPRWCSTHHHSTHIEHILFGVCVRVCVCARVSSPPPSSFFFLLSSSFFFSGLWPRLRQDYPLNLSILLSGGKETNKDSLSNGEWSGNSSSLKPKYFHISGCSIKKECPGEWWSKCLGIDCHGGWEPRSWLPQNFSSCCDTFSSSRAAWECSVKWVVYFI